MRLQFSFCIFLVSICSCAFSQNNISDTRLYFHRTIDRAQLNLQTADGKSDGKFLPYVNNDKLNQISNEAATKGIDNLQDFIEAQNWDNNKKIKYLRGLAGLIDGYQGSFLSRKVVGTDLPIVLKAFKHAMMLDSKGEDITSVIEDNTYEVSYLIANVDAFQKNAAASNFDDLLIRKSLADKPANALNILNSYLYRKQTDFPGTDSILHRIAVDTSDAIYNWSKAFGVRYPLGERIRKSNDSLVQTIARIASAQGLDGSKTGTWYMPFLDDIYHGNITMDQIEDAMHNPVKYYKLLVNTEVNYAGRMIKHDTALAWQLTRDKLSSVATDNFINIVNGLHEKPNEERYACLKPLSAVDLYYLVVMPMEENIYTSTYVNGKDYGLYNLIWQKGGKDLTGEKLLMDVNMDYFKKWIKMAANYNTLDNFLSRMQRENSQMLIKAFVKGLDKSSTKDELEDAVNVASSYSSINDPSTKQLVLNEVQRNLNIAKHERNNKAYNIYYILNTLFLSMDPSNNVNVSERLGIEPVYYLPINELKDTSGRIIIQEFTYGDPDGQVNYDRFIDAYSRADWKISTNKFWSTVSSKTGTPIIIYVNRPYTEKPVGDQPSDEEAQHALNTYLDENDIHPTLAFHRGHSYHLISTIKQLEPSEKLVFLGSCGGFQSLNEVLKKCPGTQIISTKQTGVGDLNLSMIQSIIAELQKGKDINWVKMWKGYTKELSKDNRFADYVPPYENLGAVFLVAYQKLESQEGRGITIDENKMK